MSKYTDDEEKEFKDINRQGYFIVTFNWKTGFVEQQAVRGFWLRSMIRYGRKLTWVDPITYNEITEEEYNKLLHGEKKCQSSSHAGTESKVGTKSTKSRQKKSQEIVVEQSPIKVSAKTAKTNTNSGEKSSTPRKKKETG